MAKMVRVSAPATIANLGPGFDVFGLALSNPFDIVEAEKSKSGVEVVEVRGVGAEGIPKSSNKNSAAIAAVEAMRLIGAKGGVKLKIQKGIKTGSGIGSSGASAVAGVVASNELFDGRLSNEQLIEAAASAEEKIAGSIHYDNVTASLIGGFTIVTSTDPLEFLKLEALRMKIVVAQPEIELTTALVRKLLPKKVPLEAATANVGRASTMIAALKAGDLKTFGRCMVDRVAEPFRVPFIQGFLEVRRSALKARAIGVAMAGSGPSVFAIVEPHGNAELVARAMVSAFKKVKVKCDTIITSPGGGARVIERR